MSAPNLVAIESSKGSLLRVLAPEDGKVIEYHPVFGFVSETSLKERHSNRRRHGFTRHPGSHEFKFKFSLQDGQWVPEAVTDCQIKKGPSESRWNVLSKQGTFHLRPVSESEEWAGSVEAAPDENKKILISALVLFLMMIGGLHLLSLLQPAETGPQVVEQTTVKIAPEVRQTVTVSVPEALKNQNVKEQDQIKKAMRQSMGFLGLLGRKDLNKAVGGAPTHLKDASPGAGFGGTGGSGGEELYVGLGQGLQHSTIGNTGVAGLGGIGTKGAGGGQGGYGNNAIGGPGGKSLASGPLSQDIVLEGGLDSAVVQATIAKYLSQVRACYETGLARNAGLGGFVRVFFEIGGSGNLNFSRVKDSSLGDPEVEQCITQRMMGWKFPNPRGGVNVKVTYPFLLRSARS